MAGWFALWKLRPHTAPALKGGESCGAPLSWVEVAIETPAGTVGDRLDLRHPWLSGLQTDHGAGVRSS